jgi:WD40 repeat protein
MMEEGSQIRTATGNSVAWSRDGTELAITDGRTLRTERLDGTVLSSIGTDVWPYNVAWGRQPGAGLAFEAFEWEWWEDECCLTIWVARDTGLGLSAARIDYATELWTPVWIPGSDTLVAASYLSLETFGPDGTSFGPLLPITPTEEWSALFSPSFSPDGRYLAYLEGGWSYTYQGWRGSILVVVDRVTGTSEQVPLSWGRPSRVSWTPEGEHLLIVAGDANGPICVFLTDLRGANPRPLVSCESGPVTEVAFPPQ